MIGDFEVDENSFNWSSNLNTTFQITPTTRLQTNMSYRSKSVRAQGYSNGTYYMNLAFRQDLFKRKISATLQLRDVFGTNKRDSYSFGENFDQSSCKLKGWLADNIPDWKDFKIAKSHAYLGPAIGPNADNEIWNRAIDKYWSRVLRVAGLGLSAYYSLLAYNSYCVSCLEYI